MSKIKISTNAFLYPMPLVLVGTVVGDRANFMPDNNYWAVGDHLGKAWSIGKRYLK